MPAPAATEPPAVSHSPHSSYPRQPAARSLFLCACVYSLLPRFTHTPQSPPIDAYTYTDGVSRPPCLPPSLTSRPLPATGGCPPSLPVSLPVSLCLCPFPAVSLAPALRMVSATGAPAQQTQHAVAEREARKRDRTNARGGEGQRERERERETRSCPASLSLWSCSSGRSGWLSRMRCWPCTDVVFACSSTCAMWR